MVMGRNSHSKGLGFDSRRRILDGHFSHICCKNCKVCLKRLKINEKEAGVGPFFKKTGECNKNKQEVGYTVILPLKSVFSGLVNCATTAVQIYVL